MSRSTKNYSQEARDDAKEMANYFINEIVQQLIDSGKASNDLFNNYPNGDSYHHESHVDKDYSLINAAELLDDLSDYEETDSGLWESLSPRDAVGAQAAYTYGNAVYSIWRKIIEDINDNPVISDALQDREDGEPISNELIQGMVEQIIEDY